MRLALAFFAALVVGTMAGSARAVEPDEMLKSPVLETRARDISTGLRCLVCQNQSIDDSDAPLAHDLRVLVRERLTAGDTDGQVRDYLVARYGPFILLRPPLGMSTVLLWTTPLVCLVLGGALLLARRPRVQSVPVPLDPAEQDKLRRLTEEG